MLQLEKILDQIERVAKEHGELGVLRAVKDARKATGALKEAAASTALMVLHIRSRTKEMDGDALAQRVAEILQSDEYFKKDAS